MKEPKPWTSLKTNWTEPISRCFFFPEAKNQEDLPDWSEVFFEDLTREELAGPHCAWGLIVPSQGGHQMDSCSSDSNLLLHKNKKGLCFCRCFLLMFSSIHLDQFNPQTDWTDPLLHCGIILFTIRSHGSTLHQKKVAPYWSWSSTLKTRKLLLSFEVAAPPESQDMSSPVPIPTSSDQLSLDHTSSDCGYFFEYLICFITNWKYVLFHQ